MMTRKYRGFLRDLVQESFGERIQKSEFLRDQVGQLVTPERLARIKTIGEGILDGIFDDIPSLIDLARPDLKITTNGGWIYWELVYQEDRK